MAEHDRGAHARVAQVGVVAAEHRRGAERLVDDRVRGADATCRSRLSSSSTASSKQRAGSWISPPTCQNSGSSSRAPAAQRRAVHHAVALRQHAQPDPAHQLAGALLRRRPRAGSGRARPRSRDPAPGRGRGRRRAPPRPRARAGCRSAGRSRPPRRRSPPARWSMCSSAASAARIDSCSRRASLATQPYSAQASPRRSREPSRRTPPRSPASAPARWPSRGGSRR